MTCAPTGWYFLLAETEELLRAERPRVIPVKPVPALSTVVNEINSTLAETSGSTVMIPRPKVLKVDVLIVSPVRVFKVLRKTSVSEPPWARELFKVAIKTFGGMVVGLKFVHNYNTKLVIFLVSDILIIPKIIRIEGGWNIGNNDSSFIESNRCKSSCRNNTNI
jgi:hypothetical protein